MATCVECKSEYDDNNITISLPIPDNMCGSCGTLLTDEKIKTITQQLNS
jgi:hypothetical protein